MTAGLGTTIATIRKAPVLHSIAATAATATAVNCSSRLSLGSSSCRRAAVGGGRLASSPSSSSSSMSMSIKNNNTTILVLPPRKKVNASTALQVPAAEVIPLKQKNENDDDHHHDKRRFDTSSGQLRIKKPKPRGAAASSKALTMQETGTRKHGEGIMTKKTTLTGAPSLWRISGTSKVYQESATWRNRKSPKK